MQARNRGEWRPAAERPVARVAVDVALAHLDRPFDYAVPQHLDPEVAEGVRVRVRFAGRLVDGYVLERVARSAHDGRLAWIEKVISPEQALTPEVAALCRAVADRYGGVLADVLRLAVPPRHARVEKETVDRSGTTGANPTGDDEAATGGRSDAAGERAAAAAGARRSATEGGSSGAAGDVVSADWARYPRGPAFLRALREGRAAHAVWQALPGEAWADRLADAAVATVGGGRGALLVVPDQRDVDLLLAACVERLGTAPVVALTAELGPAQRYRRWLAVRRGQAKVVVGTRSAVFAPLADPGLLVIWDDGDDSHAEPRAPYPHARDVLVLRAHAVGAALLVGGYARTAEGQLLVESGWASEIVADRSTVRTVMPRVHAQGESDQQLARDPLARAARLPSVAFEAARAALAAGRPVLVQNPRAGYLPWLACAACRETARCRHCAGPLALSGASMAGAAPSADHNGRRPPIRDPDDRAGPENISARVGGAGDGVRNADEAADGARRDGLIALPFAEAATDGRWGDADVTSRVDNDDRRGGGSGRRPDGADRASGGQRPLAGRAAAAGGAAVPNDRRSRPAAVTAERGVVRALPVGVSDRNADHAPSADHAGAVKTSLPSCRWCGRVEAAYRCGACGSRRLRAGVVGSRRTAEELGRAFPGAAVRTSGGGAPVLATVSGRPEIVVATPGAEPRSPTGYGAVLLLDGWALLARPDLRVAEETLRRWMAAAAMVVPHRDGGQVLVVADPALPPVQALVRWDPAGHAAAELAARTEVGFPPAVRMAAIEGAPSAVADVLDELSAQLDGAEVLGPVELEPLPDARAGQDPVRERALVRVPHRDGRALAAALHAAQAAQAARKAADPVRVRVDPPEVG